MEAFEPGVGTGNGVMEVAERVFAARLVMGPHGANLNNLWAARPGAWVIEFGYPFGPPGLPAPYFGMARNLGLCYWLSMAVNGGVWGQHGSRC